jgi:hypothetical protein
MRYAEIADIEANRFRLPSSHPVLAEITIDPADRDRLQQLCIGNTTTRILGHDAPQAGEMVAYVACVSLAVRDRLENGLLGLMDVRR